MLGEPKAPPAKGDRRVEFAWTRSKTSLRDRDRRVFAALVESGSARALARGRMFRFSVEARDRKFGDPPIVEGPLDGLTLEESALVLLEDAHSDLHSKGLGAILEPGAAFELFADRSWALRALRYLYSPQETKQIELRVTGGAPLSICMGRPAYVTSPKVQTVPLPERLAYRLGRSEAKIPVYGCLGVFEESTNTGSGRQWRLWCPEHHPKDAQPLRAAKRLHLRRLHKLPR